MSLLKKITRKQFYTKCMLILILSALISISGCGTSQITDFYQLEESTDTSLTGLKKGSVIGVGPINLPEYINRPQIVTRKSKHQFNVSEFKRWIEPLNDSISRLLVINLSNNLNSNQIYWVPRSDRQYPLDLRVVIDVGRFDGQLGKDVSLEARWSIFDKQDQPALTRVSIIKESTRDQSYEALVAAMNKALQQLGLEIADAASSLLKK